MAKMEDAGRSAIERLRQSESQFEGAFRSAAIGMAIVDLAGMIVDANPSFERMLGRAKGTLGGLHFRDFTHPDDIDADLGLFADILDGKIESYQMEKRYLRANGGVAHGMLSVSAVRDVDGQAIRFVSQIEDITARKIAERAAAQNAARFQLAMSMIDGGSWTFDIAKNHYEASPQLTRLFAKMGITGLGLAELQGAIPLEDRAAIDYRKMLAGNIDRQVVHYRIVDAQGRVRWLRTHRQLLRDEQGKPSVLVGFSVDISDERDREEALVEQATTDPLTGLLNRRGVEQRTAALRAARGPDCQVAVIVVDLDGFKQVNDRFGHVMGDHVLVEVARRLIRRLRPHDLIARLGGDEFLVVLEDVGRSDAENAARRIVRAVSRPMQFADCHASVGASVGVALGMLGQVEPTELIARADAKLFQAKRRGRSGWAIAA